MQLYAITDRRQWAADEPTRRRELVRRAVEAAEAGVDYVQLREKDLSCGELERLADELLRAIRATGAATKLLINSRLDVALAVGADGLHLAGGAMSAAEAREIAKKAGRREPLVISAACHSAVEAEQARAAGCDLALLSPIYEKPGTPLEGLGLEALRQAPKGWPMLALGGVNEGNAKECVLAGAAGVAGIRLFFGEGAAGRIARLRAEG